MRNRIVPISILIVTALFGIFLKNDFIRFLLGFELVLFLGEFLEAQYLSGKISGQICIGKSMVKKGEPFQIKVQLSNQSPISVPEIFVRVAVRIFPEENEVLLTGRVMLDEKEEGDLTFSMESDHCGCLEIRLERIVVQDHLGLFQKRCRDLDKQVKLLFLHPTGNLGADTDLNIAIVPEGEEGKDLKRGRSGEDFVGIRTYQQGDLFKLVHWKLSARMNELMVREMGKTGETLYRVYLNLEEKDKKKERDRMLWDTFFENTEVITQALIRAGFSFSIFWIDRKKGIIQQYQVSDAATRTEMMCALLHTDGYLPEEGTEIVKELPIHELESEIIEISLQGNITSWSTGA